MEPTQAQIDFVQDICNELQVEPPDRYTKEDYSEFISEYKDQLYNRRKRNYYRMVYLT